MLNLQFRLVSCLSCGLIPSFSIIHSETPFQQESMHEAEYFVWVIILKTRILEPQPN